MLTCNELVQVRLTVLSQCGRHDSVVTVVLVHEDAMDFKSECTNIGTSRYISYFGALA